jgi:tetratricopeptide (TPR) repeat protein
MVSATRTFFLSLLVVPSVLAPTWAQVTDGLRPAAIFPPEPKAEITPELRGDIMMARKMYREAIDYYKPGAEKSAILANKTGIAYHQLLDLNNAKKYYQRAIKLNPKYPEAINNLGTVYYAQKSYRRAIDQYRKALRVSPNSASILSNLGTAYFARKKYEEALRLYQQALAINPDILESRSSQGSVVQERSVEEKAKFNYYMAKTYAKMGAVDRALQCVRRALEDGFKERMKFIEEPEFAALQDNVEFKQLMATELKVL